MKILKFALLFMAAYTIGSCSDDNDSQTQIIDETSGLTITKTFENQDHKLAIFTENGKLTDGYNKIYIQLKDQNGDLVSDVDFSWMPMMQMENMQHSGPHSEIKKVQEKQSLYEAWVVFQMAGDNQNNFWNLNFDYIKGGNNYQMSDNIDVQPSAKRRVTSFVGSDDVKYIIAFVEPNNPKVATNDMTAAVFKMASMNDFPVVNNYKVKIDPRMPGMGNHGTPNNVDLTQGSDGFYHGKLNLSMTGYWIINLMLENQNGEILKGEEVTEENPKSSIYFEIEF